MLRDQFGARRIVLVGSLDAPWFTEQSDVDLVVEGISSGRAGFAEERTVELLGVRVDLLRYEELDESFREVVAREGRQIS
ncbi:MAG: nucleotidyltransferase domain-containing protein [Myxococcales bacterium]|nr:nucleotidyltransferase domain-containing protein [Myxococcales bacterium]